MHSQDNLLQLVGTDVGVAAENCCFCHKSLGWGLINKRLLLSLAFSHALNRVNQIAIFCWFLGTILDFDQELIDLSIGF